MVAPVLVLAGVVQFFASDELSLRPDHDRAGSSLEAFRRGTRDV